METRSRRALVAIGATATVAFGLSASFLTLPSSCDVSAREMITALPGTLGLWVANVILWLGGLGAIVLVVWRRTETKPVAAVFFAVLAWGFLGAAGVYYFLAAPQDSLSCSTDPLGVLLPFAGSLAAIAFLISALSTRARLRGEGASKARPD